MRVQNFPMQLIRFSLKKPLNEFISLRDSAFANKVMFRESEDNNLPDQILIILIYTSLFFRCVALLCSSKMPRLYQNSRRLIGYLIYFRFPYKTINAV